MDVRFGVVPRAHQNRQRRTHQSLIYHYYYTAFLNAVVVEQYLAWRDLLRPSIATAIWLAIQPSLKLLSSMRWSKQRNDLYGSTNVFLANYRPALSSIGSLPDEIGTYLKYVRISSGSEPILESAGL